MKRRLASLIALAMVGTIALTSCSSGSGSTTPAPANTDSVQTEGKDYGGLKYLRMCSGTQGATWTTVGSAMMEYVGSAVKDMGVSASNGPGGSVANCRAVANGEYELGWAFTSTVYDAYGATGAFSEDEPMENLTHIMSIFPSQQHFVVPADSSIQSLADINGKVVNFTPVTETSYTVNNKVFEAYGINQDTIESAGGTVTLTRFNEASELLKNGELDLWTACIAAPGSAVSDMAFAPGIRFVNIDEDKIPQILEQLPGFTEMTIPAGTYEGVDEDVRTVGTVGSIFCTADLPEDVVYDSLKTIYENWDALKAINPTAFGDLDVNDWLNGATAPIHPGAEKFYKEMGVM